MARKRHRSDWGTVQARYLRHSDEQVGWIARYRSPIIGDGTVNRNFPLDAKSEAYAWLDKEHELVRAYERGESEWLRPSERKRRRKLSSVTFSEYADKWLADYRTTKGTRPKGSTLRKLKVDVAHLDATFGDVRMRDITSDMVSSWLDNPNIEGDYAVFNAYKTLRAIMRAACKPGDDGTPPVCDRNPCTRQLASPESKQATIPTATPDQLRAIYDTMPDYSRIAVYLSSTAGGLRESEVCALRVSDVDLERRLLHVRSSVNRGDDDRGALVLDDPKTASSVRDVIIPARLVPLLEAHIRTFCDKGPDAMLIRPRHAHIMARGTLYAQFKKAAKAAGRGDLHFHTLRATATTNMVLAGASLAEVMRFAGHADTQTAVERYQRVIGEHARTVSDRLGDSLITPERTPNVVKAELADVRKHIEELQAQEKDLLEELKALKG